MYDIVIIGAGPGGISSALYAHRANMNVLVLYNDEGELNKAHKIDNYYGFPDGIDGKELFNNGIKQAKNLDINIKQEEVLDIKYKDNSYDIITKENKYETKSIILATGIKRVTPSIKNINEYEGKGISYCAICDGFFYKNKKVAVLGSEDYALSEAKELSNIASEVIILTDGNKMTSKTDFNIIEHKISSIEGKDKLEKVIFENGEELTIDGLFIAIGTAGGIDFAKKLGILTDKNNIIVNENMETNVKGIYAVGNLTGGLLQVNKAVYQGAKAGISASNYIKSERRN